MYSLLILLVSLSVVFGHDALRRYTELDEKDMPRQVIHLVRRSEGNFCCKNIPIEIVKKSRSVSRLKVDKNKIKVGTESCGFLGIGKCSKYDFEYKQVSFYTTEYYAEPVEGACKGAALTCCNGYFFIKKYQRCVLLSELSTVVKELEEERKKQEEIDAAAASQ